jgi:hypothetical protein
MVKLFWTTFLVVIVTPLEVFCVPGAENIKNLFSNDFLAA